MEMELKRQNAKMPKHGDEDEQTKEEDASPTAAARAETKKLLTQGESLDRADIDRELQMILKKNRSAYAQKAADEEEEADEESRRIWKASNHGDENINSFCSRTRPFLAARQASWLQHPGVPFIWNQDYARQAFAAAVLDT